MPSILALSYGLAGSTGNSMATGAVVAAIAFLATLAWHRPPAADLAVAALAAAARASIVATIDRDGRNETIAFVITLAAYVAGRGLSSADLPMLRSATIAAAGAITAIGTRPPPR
ncbi:hypothetical protein V1290_000353 [Bradyrhizobium sp. AZCC 1578]|uniref:hypothetical protein n=1 Tax=Bradyrhizobium sp. AZCC 1578 TaxID=3117027 RepID=UPI002FF0A5E7